MQSLYVLSTVLLEGHDSVQDQLVLLVVTAVQARELALAVYRKVGQAHPLEPDTFLADELLGGRDRYVIIVPATLNYGLGWRSLNLASLGGALLCLFARLIDVLLGELIARA